MKRFLVFSILCLLSFQLLAQEEYEEDSIDFEEPLKESLFLSDRAPLFFKLGFVQKVYKPASIVFDAENARFTKQRSHSAGIVFGFDFGLNNPTDFDGLWTVNTSFGLTSYSLHYEGVFFADRFGFDRDALAKGRIYSTAIEGSLKLNHHKKFKNNLIGVLGLGFNVQDINIRNNFFEASAVVLQGGELTRQLMFSTNNDFVFPNTTSHNINLLWTAGIGKNFNRNQLLLIELRVCQSKTTDLQEELFSPLGFVGQMILHKSYVGIDLSYTFAANQRSKIWTD